MNMLELHLKNRRATRHLGTALAPLLAIGDVVWLEGELGAGKTFLARAILRGLGVPATIPVTSPTFALVHEHEGRIPIRHLDLYRLEAADDLVELGFDEAREHAVVLMEWGARFRDVLGSAGLEIALSLGDAATERKAAIRPLDERGADIVARLAAEPAMRAIAR
jgi:tRNA threonylcarbamoyladenosine biosynthesis protein TsaE